MLWIAEMPMRLEFPSWSFVIEQILGCWHPNEHEVNNIRFKRTWSLQTARRRPSKLTTMALDRTKREVGYSVGRMGSKMRKSLGYTCTYQP